MARTCQISKRGTTTGNNVSHSNRHTRRTFGVNVHKRTLVNPATGTTMRIALSTASLRTLMKWEREGKTYDLRTLIKD